MEHKAEASAKPQRRLTDCESEISMSKEENMEVLRLAACAVKVLLSAEVRHTCGESLSVHRRFSSLPAAESSGYHKCGQLEPYGSLITSSLPCSPSSNYSKTASLPIWRGIFGHTRGGGEAEKETADATLV